MYKYPLSKILLLNRKHHPNAVMLYQQPIIVSTVLVQLSSIAPMVEHRKNIK